MIDIFQTFNYIVPASGRTKGYVINFSGLATDPKSTDFSQLSLNGIPFTPSGVIVDNSGSPTAATITIQPINFNIVIPAGKQMAVQYPAVEGHTAQYNITNVCTVVFVDYPVIPYEFPIPDNAGQTTVNNNSISDYPLNATPVVSSVSGAAAAITATMPAVAGKTNYISGFQINGSGSTAASLVTAILSGVLGGSQNYEIAVVAGATLVNQSINVNFNKPIPASAVNTAINLTVPSLGAGNTNSNATIWGYVL